MPRCSTTGGLILRLAGACAGVVFGVALLPGCAKPLLSPSDERTPFDRYDALRNQYAQQYVEDEYGARRPNLRARLGQK